MINKLQLELKIELLLGDIKSYTDSAYYYLAGFNDKLDKDEIIMYISAIPEIIEEIRNIISKLEQEYENDLIENNQF